MHKSKNYNSDLIQNKMSNNKIRSLFALILALVGVFQLGIFAEIPSIVLSIMVLASKKYKEKEAKIMAILALVISSIFVLLTIILFVLMLLGLFNLSSLLT